MSFGQALSAEPDSPKQRRGAIGAAIVITVVTSAAYANSFGGPFVFDDLLSIRDNPTLASVWRALVPPSNQGLTVEGRPLLNFSFALNRAFSGQSVWSYHATNLAIHVMAALTLFGVIRRTFSLAVFGESVRRVASALGLAVALLWAVHPVQTESVTYLVQRAEALMGMWFLLVFYGFIRSTTEHGSRWTALAIGAGYAAAFSKEVAAAIPPLILAYDRTFVSGSFQGAWRARGRFHATLFGTWVVIAALVASSGSRGGTVGFGSNVDWLDYAWTQVEAIAVYVRLAFWPAPLIFDYGALWVRPGWELLPSALLVLGVVAGTAIALVRRPMWGFLGLWFLAMLAPTSLVPGNRQTISEHRIYLSLAAPVLIGVFALFRICGARRGLWIAGVAAAGFAVLVARRNIDYRSDVALFTDTIVKRPGNVFAHYNLGKALAESGHPERAIPAYQEAVRLAPAMVGVHYNLGNAYAEIGRHADAIVAFERALALEPNYARARYNLGNSFVALGRRDRAREQFAAAVQAAPDFVDARANLASVLLELGELDQAATELAEVLRHDSSSVTARVNLAQVRRLQGRNDEARTELERVLQLAPNFEPARAALREWFPDDRRRHPGAH
jgi:Flp pilus assembly protein TadD